MWRHLPGSDVPPGYPNTLAGAKTSSSPALEKPGDSEAAPLLGSLFHSVTCMVKNLRLVSHLNDLALTPVAGSCSAFGW